MIRGNRVEIRVQSCTQDIGLWRLLKVQNALEGGTGGSIAGACFWSCFSAEKLLPSSTGGRRDFLLQYSIRDEPDIYVRFCPDCGHFEIAFDTWFLMQKRRCPVCLTRESQSTPVTSQVTPVSQAGA